MEQQLGCGLVLDHGVLAFGHSTVLTATCEMLLAYGVLIVGYGMLCDRVAHSNVRNDARPRRPCRWSRHSFQDVSTCLRIQRYAWFDRFMHCVSPLSIWWFSHIVHVKVEPGTVVR